MLCKLYSIMGRTWPSRTLVPMAGLGTSSLQILRQLFFNFDLHFPVACGDPCFSHLPFCFCFELAVHSRAAVSYFACLCIPE